MVNSSCFSKFPPFTHTKNATSVFIYFLKETIIGILWPQVSLGGNLGVLQSKDAAHILPSPPHPDSSSFPNPQPAHLALAERAQLFIYPGIQGKILLERLNSATKTHLENSFFIAVCT